MIKEKISIIKRVKILVSLIREIVKENDMEIAFSGISHCKDCDCNDAIEKLLCFCHDYDCNDAIEKLLCFCCDSIN